MKNLILPFVVVAMFAVGSCGDETSVNPPGDKEDSTAKTTAMKAIIHISNIRALFEEHTSIFNSTDSRYNRHDSSEVERMISFQDTLISEHVEKIGDTLMIALLDTASYKTNDPRHYTDITTKSIKIIVDTTNSTFSLIQYSSTIRREYYKITLDPYNTYNGSDTQNRYFTLKNVKFSRNDSTQIIHLQPLSYPTFAEFLVNHDAYHTTRDGGLSTITTTRTYSVFEELLPFTNESSIYIELK